MKLSELSYTEHVKALIYGDSGTGKTCTALGFPGPIEVWDFDGKANSAAFFYRNDKERLGSIEVYDFAKIPKETRIAEWEKRAKEIDKLAKEGKLPFKTLVLDSLTTFVQSILDDYIYRSQKGIKRPVEGLNSQQDYGLLDRHLTQIITGLLSLKCNVVFLGHVLTEKDELTGSVTKKPFMSGKYADKLPIYFEEVYVSRISSNGGYILQTQGDHHYKCRTQRGLPKEIPASYEEIIKKR